MTNSNYTVHPNVIYNLQNCWNLSVRNIQLFITNFSKSLTPIMLKTYLVQRFISNVLFVSKIC